jgi:hypothetical protein
MKILKGLLLAGVASAAPVMFMANTASAAPATFKTVTHLANRQDTCTCTTNVHSPNGDVWALDNISRQFTVTQTAPGTYNVVATDNGSFVASAQPNSGDPTTDYPINVDGTIKGNIAFTVVTSNHGPSALPSQIPGTESTTQMILAMFGDLSASVSMTSYNYTYTAGAEVYSQTWSTTTPLVINGNIA